MNFCHAWPSYFKLIGFRSLHDFNFVDPSLAERNVALKETYSTCRELKHIEAANGIKKHEVKVVQAETALGGK